MREVTHENLIKGNQSFQSTDSKALLNIGHI